MDKIDSIEELTNPKFVKPIKINYTSNNQKRVWEAVISHDSVSILLYHTQKKAFIVVKQLRVAVLNANKKDGKIHELCAGIVDKNLPNIEIAREEVLEECGYDVPLENISKINSFYTSVGISGALQTFYYATCDDSMKVSEGGGLEDENIEVIYIPLEKAKEFLFDETQQKNSGIMMAFYWFFETIQKQLWVKRKVI